jgi:hypothetical protein
VSVKGVLTCWIFKKKRSSAAPAGIVTLWPVVESSTFPPVPPPNQFQFVPPLGTVSPPLVLQIDVLQIDDPKLVEV